MFLGEFLFEDRGDLRLNLGLLYSSEEIWKKFYRKIGIVTFTPQGVYMKIRIMISQIIRDIFCFGWYPRAVRFISS